MSGPCTFVLVAGALHPVWMWHRVVPLLEQAGHVCHAPELPGMGEDRSIGAGDATLELWSRSIAALVRTSAMPVMLVGHSRGGLVIGEAAELACERIAGLIAPPGATGQDVMGSDTGVEASWLTPDGNAFLIPKDTAKAIFYNRCDPELAEQACARLTPEPVSPITVPSRVTWEHWGKLPRAYVECRDDRTLVLERQRLIQRAAPCDPVWQLDADHSPFLSDPEGLADALLNISAQFVTP